MDNRQLQLILKLQDEVTAELKKVQGSFNQTKKESDNMVAGIKTKLESLKPVFSKMATWGTAAFLGIGYGIKSTIDAFAESQAQLARVDQSLRNSIKQFGGNFDELSQKARDYGTQLQRIGGIGDEAGAEGFAKLLQVSAGDATKASELANTAADLSIAKQIDYMSAVKLVSMAMSGNVKLLKEYGIELDENATASDNLVRLQQAVAGQYEASGQTIEGQSKIIKESFGDLKESIGQSFLPILKEVIETIKPIVQKITEWIEEHPELTRNILLATLAISGLVAGIGFLGLVLPPVIAGFALLASPIGIVTMLIVGIIGIIIRCANQIKSLKGDWDLVWLGMKITIKEVWEWIKEHVFDPMSDRINKIIDSIKSMINWIKDAAKNVANSGFGQAVGSLFGRASGGSVNGTQPYIVGETGPEIFIPRSSGTIIPNSVGGSGGVVVNVYGDVSGMELVDKVQEAIMISLRSNMKISI